MLKAAAFSEVLAFLPLHGGQLGTENSAQYLGNCACLKTFPSMGAQHIQCFSFPARACSPNAMLHEQQD